ncbi:hypothetical protein BDZ85DRAFT_270122 [Elsinoe ampelina]|uniref:Uncharacterized protein n=1 Tax=Elsinoe ampelina TaxID=302913 RepID=A0A6A6FYL6_9PEZI|nr:hypothetical protein BDZ85DRAFT_270122 [Elsinoe ampelina]
MRDSTHCIMSTCSQGFNVDVSTHRYSISKRASRLFVYIHHQSPAYTTHLFPVPTRHSPYQIISPLIL